MLTIISLMRGCDCAQLINNLHMNCITTDCPVIFALQIISNSYPMLLLRFVYLVSPSGCSRGVLAQRFDGVCVSNSVVIRMIRVIQQLLGSQGDDWNASLSAYVRPVVTRAVVFGSKPVGILTIFLTLDQAVRCFSWSVWRCTWDVLSEIKLSRLIPVPLYSKGELCPHCCFRYVRPFLLLI